ncbi:Formate-dependent nitrite reductase, membrane component NrfD [Pseudonocardia oroxyli]|uniref:Formate-dependent nitrite reductase, membrane component NrfD n=2 Tax=Pseudonocardia oroxyli TaxID=366584 RepID=A0A1G7WL24_PSEOR|nr:Formate-dependent nitrite reductase, membrane component NrfD [Pseudonocardia oroxyli]
MTGPDEERTAAEAGVVAERPSDAGGSAAREAEMFQGGRRRRGGEQTVVPEAEIESYYGRPVLKPPVWEWKIAAYLFCGGLAAGSSVVAAGADLTGRAALRRSARLGSLGGLLASLYFLVTDLGRPARFHHMLRVLKPTSPMSVGTWLLSAYGPGAGAAAVAELVPRRWRRTWPARLLQRLARPAGLGAAATAPGVASYTAVLLSHTAVPAWNEVRDELPFVFAGSAAASGGGLGMVTAPVAEAGGARGFAAAGAATELLASRIMEHRLGLVGEVYRTGHVARLRRASEVLTAAGLVGTLTVARRGRAGAAASGLALLAGSALQRFGVFEAGVESTKDPRYVVIPQRG